MHKQLDDVRVPSQVSSARFTMGLPLELKLVLMRAWVLTHWRGFQSPKAFLRHLVIDSEAPHLHLFFEIQGAARPVHRPTASSKAWTQGSSSRLTLNQELHTERMPLDSRASSIEPGNCKWQGFAKRLACLQAARESCLTTELPVDSTAQKFKYIQDAKLAPNHRSRTQTANPNRL